MPFSKLKAYLRRRRSGIFLACVVESEYSRAISPHAKPRIILGTLAMREIDRNLL